MAGLIGLADVDKDGLASTALVRGTTATERTDPIQIDFNEYTGQSIALVSGANSPTGNTTRYYLLIQKEDIGRMKKQTAQDYETGLVYHRTYTTKKGEWSAWVLENFGYNSLADLSAGVAGEMFSLLNASVTKDLRSAPSGVWFVYDPTMFSDCPYDSGIGHTSMLISVNDKGNKCHVLIDVESVSTNNQGVWVSYQTQIWKKIL